MVLVKNISVYIAHINDIFQNDKLIVEEININLYKTKIELVNYFNKKYSIKDSILIYNLKILDNLDNIDDYLILLNNDEIRIDNEININTNTVNNLFTSIINNLLDNSDQPIDLISNLQNVSENREPINNATSNEEYSEESDILEQSPLPSNDFSHSGSNNFAFINELEQLEFMGFTDTYLNKEALIISNGDIDKSVNYILENIY